MRVDFYQLPQADQTLNFLCRLLQKIYGQGLHAYVHEPSAERCTMLNQALWTFDPISFVPHQHVSELPLQAPILLGDQWPTQATDVCINLSAECLPESVELFMRAVELILPEENAKARSREKYRHYQQLGWELHVQTVK
jgi:DNA polymerase-3 subunit chi